MPLHSLSVRAKRQILYEKNRKARPPAAPQRDEVRPALGTHCSIFQKPCKLIDNDFEWLHMDLSIIEGKS